MIPHDLEPSHIKSAIEQIEQEGVPNARRSRRYKLLFNGKLYPPKYVISLASKFATGKMHRFQDFNAIEAIGYFNSHKYTIVDMLMQAQIQNETPIHTFSEGKRKFKIHCAIERDKRLPKIAKNHRLLQYGSLECDVCGFDFAKVYGKIGFGYIEAHHITPISQLSEDTKTKIEDIALVCANCHRMLHGQSEELSLAQLKKCVIMSNRHNTNLR